MKIVFPESSEEININVQIHLLITIVYSKALRTSLRYHYGPPTIKTAGWTVLIYLFLHKAYSSLNSFGEGPKERQGEAQLPWIYFHLSSVSILSWSESQWLQSLSHVHWLWYKTTNRMGNQDSAPSSHSHLAVIL